MKKVARSKKGKIGTAANSFYPKDKSKKKLSLKEKKDFNKYYGAFQDAVYKK